ASGVPRSRATGLAADNRHALWGHDADLRPVPFDLDELDLDLVADDDALAGLALDDQPEAVAVLGLRCRAALRDGTSGERLAVACPQWAQGEMWAEHPGRSASWPILVVPSAVRHGLVADGTGHGPVRVGVPNAPGSLGAPGSGLSATPCAAIA